MQTRSQTRKLLQAQAQALEKDPTKDASIRVLPDSIKNVSYESEHTLYMPQYLKKPLYDVDIDFDEASEAWRANKTSIGNGQYKYKKRVKF